MGRIRFSIANLLGLVLLAAIAFASLREASDLWDSALFTAVLGLLLASALLAVHRRGRGRAFWSGFALCGSAYLVASLIPPVESRLLTTRGLTALESMIARPRDSVALAVRWLKGDGQSAAVEAVAFSDYEAALATTRGGQVRLWNASTGKLLAGTSSTSENFVRIGHSILALAMALAGGHLSRRLYTARGTPAAGAVVRDPPSPPATEMDHPRSPGPSGESPR